MSSIHMLYNQALYVGLSERPGGIFFVLVRYGD